MTRHRRTAIHRLMAAFLLLGTTGIVQANPVLWDFEAFLEHLPPDAGWAHFQAQHPDDVTWMQRLHDAAAHEPDIETRLRMRDAAISLYHQHGRFAPEEFLDAMQADARASGDLDWQVQALEHSIRSGNGSILEAGNRMALHDELLALLRDAPPEQAVDAGERLAAAMRAYASDLENYAYASHPHFDEELGEDTRAAMMEDAIRRYEALIAQASPEDLVAGDYHGRVAALYQRHGQPEEAGRHRWTGATVAVEVYEARLAAAADISWDELRLFTRLAEAYEHLQLHEDAAAVYWEAYEHALSLGGAPPQHMFLEPSQFYTAHLAAMHGRDSEDYHRELSRFLLEHPADRHFPTFISRLVGLHLAQGQYEAAIPLLERWAALQENSLQAHFRLGTVLMLAGRTDEAEAVFEQMRTMAGRENTFVLMAENELHAIRSGRRAGDGWWQTTLDRVTDWAVADDRRSADANAQKAPRGDLASVAQDSARDSRAFSLPFLLAMGVLAMMATVVYSAARRR